MVQVNFPINMNFAQNFYPFLFNLDKKRDAN